MWRKWNRVKMWDEAFFFCHYEQFEIVDDTSSSYSEKDVYQDT